ncbi:MAG: hypothetical protein HY782_00235 [Chloroflexi bacterium]|nr:hypothetical protein [Chloroflexota bacterium]
MSVPAGFIPNRDPQLFYPLRSYVRVPSATVAAEYLAALTAPGDLVLDPFASTATVARVAQKMGRRVIAVESNPLWSWLARTMAALPSAAELNAALARLGDALKDDVPLRTHINRLYTTVCAGCREPTPADYFIHARDAGPIRRHYTCAHCGETRDDSATEDDLKRAAAFDAHGLAYHFAFQRVVPAENLHADRVRKILDVYTPRNLDALVTLTVKIDALFRQPRERDILLLLLLHLLDRGTSFYPAPDAPPQLTVHKQFVEFNLWREMEAAAHALGEHAPEPIGDLATSTADVLADQEPRAFIGRGSAKALARAVPEQCAALVLSAPPTRKLAVWALSYFWGAWILGRAAVESLIASLDAHKGDPGWERRWYFDSLTGSVDALAKLLRRDAYAVFAFDETWHEVIETLLLAAAGARLELETFLFQPRLGDFPRREFDSIAGDYRVVFSRRQPAPLKILAEPQLAEKIRTAALAAGREVLTRRGEPLAYSWVHHAAYTRAFAEGYLAQVMKANTKLAPNRFVFYAVREGLSEGYAHDLDHYETPERFIWLRSTTPRDAPLIDRVDDAVREILAAHRSIACEELQTVIYRQFHGDLTPEAGLVELCAAAYAEEHDGAWHYTAGDRGIFDPAGDRGIFDREEDAETEKAHALDVLARLGERMEYRIARSAATFDLIWEWDGEISHGFLWRDRARFDDLLPLQIAPARGYLVVPETRVDLLRERVHRLPLRADAFREAGWDFVRVPFAEQLLQAEKIERHDIQLITGLVPPAAGERTQLELF